MDANSGCNQISIYGPDKEHTTFVTNQGLYCYTIMLFGLKNGGTTYQRLVNKRFKTTYEKRSKYTSMTCLLKASELKAT